MDQKKKKVFIQEQSDAAVTGYMFKGQKGTKVKLCFVDVTSVTYLFSVLLPQETTDFRQVARVLLQQLTQDTARTREQGRECASSVRADGDRGCATGWGAQGFSGV